MQSDDGSVAVGLAEGVTAAPLPSPETEANPKARRNQTIEFARIVAAFGIVGYHSTARGHDLFYAGLVFFLMASPFMEVRYNYARRRSVGQLARLFLVPWAFWSLVYAAFNLVRHRPPWPAGFDPLPGILYGTSAHLWFMPFMFGVLLLIAFAKARMSAAVFFWVSLVLAVVLLLASPVIRPWSLALNPPLAQWVHAAPPILMGIVMGLAGSVRNGRWGGVVLAAALAVAALYDIRGISVAYPVGALILFIAASAPGLFARFDVERISSCMLGVYLVHMLWLSLARPVFNRFDLAGVAVAFLGALVSVWLARRYVPASRIVLG